MSEAYEDVIRFYHEGGDLWVAMVESQWGLVEILVNGTSEKPSDRDLKIVEDFMPTAYNRVMALRRKADLGAWYRPLRVAINRDGVLGVQFQHKVFRRKRHMLLEEEA